MFVCRSCRQYKKVLLRENAPDVPPAPYLSMACPAGGEGGKGWDNPVLALSGEGGTPVLVLSRRMGRGYPCPGAVQEDGEGVPLSWCCPGGWGGGTSILGSDWGTPSPSLSPPERTRDQRLERDLGLETGAAPCGLTNKLKIFYSSDAGGESKLITLITLAPDVCKACL